MANKDSENLDMDAVAEQELSRLTRQYRIMEGDRFAYSGEVSGKLKRLRNQITILRYEQTNVLADLKIATSDGKKKDDGKLNASLDKLLEEYDCLEKTAKTQKANLSELNFQIKKMDKEIAEIKTRTTTDLQSQQRILAGQKSIILLDNKLDAYMKKFNMTVAENYKLRSEIDHLLKERAHFNLLWDKLIKSLNEGKKFMLDLIEQATIAYDQREEFCNKLQALRTRGNQDLVMHTKKIRFLQRKLDHDAKLHDFLGVKGQKRVLADLEAREARKRQQLRENMDKQLYDYKDTLRQIQDFCGESDTNKLVVNFVKQEEENFALFNYVNELNHESEHLSYAIAELKKNIDAQRELNNQREKQQKQNMATLQATLKEQTLKANKSEKYLEKFDKDLEGYFEDIREIFDLLECDEDPIFELLGDNEQINQFNCMLYLGIIEDKITFILQQVYYQERLKAEKIKKQRTQSQSMIKPDIKSRYEQNSFITLVPTTPCPLCVEQEQVSDVIDCLQYAKAEPEVEEALRIRLELPHALDRLHNVSNCHLPQSRKIIQQRYQ